MKHQVLLFVLVLCLGIKTAFAQSGTVSVVNIQGNEKTKTSFLKKVLSVQEGQQLDSLALDEDIYRLKRLPSIAHAYYEIKTVSENAYAVVYGVEENFTLIPFANVYTSNNDEFAFRVGLQEFNLFGQNVTVGAFYQKDVFGSFGANIRAPYLFGRRWGLALNYQDLTTQEPVFLEAGSAQYRYNNESIELLG